MATVYIPPLYRPKIAKTGRKQWVVMFMSQVIASEGSYSSAKSTASRVYKLIRRMGRYNPPLRSAWALAWNNFLLRAADPTEGFVPVWTTA